MKSMKDTQGLFVYETLRSLTTIEKVVGHSLTHTPVTALDVHKVPYQIDGDDYYTLEHKGQAETKGELSQVTKADLKKLDAWEDKYRRIVIVVKVPGAEREHQAVWAYVLNGKAGR